MSVGMQQIDIQTDASVIVTQIAKVSENSPQKTYTLLSVPPERMQDTPAIFLTPRSRSRTSTACTPVSVRSVRALGAWSGVCALTGLSARSLLWLRALAIVQSSERRRAARGVGRHGKRWGRRGAVGVTWCEGPRQAGFLARRVSSQGEFERVRYVQVICALVAWRELRPSTSCVTGGRSEGRRPEVAGDESPVCPPCEGSRWYSTG